MNRGQLRGREQPPLDTTVGWLWHRARKPPAQPRLVAHGSACFVRGGGLDRGERDGRRIDEKGRMEATMTASGVTGLGLG